MHVLLAQAAWLYGGLKLVGGLYLVWLGIQAWRHAAQPADGLFACTLRHDVAT